MKPSCAAFQYKMLLHGPSEEEFLQIFERFCGTRSIPCTKDLASRFVEKRYYRTGKALRRCQPRDIITHALNLIRFEKLPMLLTEEVLDRAFESCFLQEQETSFRAATVREIRCPSCA